MMARGRSDRFWRTVGVVLLGSGTVLAMAALGGASPAAGSTGGAEVIQGEHVRIESVADWGSAKGMLPGEVVRWDVTVSAEAPEPGTITVSASGQGEAPLAIDAALCRTAWVDEECPSGAEPLREDWMVPLDGSHRVLATFAHTEVVRLRLDILLDGAAVPETQSELRVHAEGFGEMVGTGPGDTLPATGGTIPLAAIIGAVVLLAAGVLLLVLRRRSRAEEDESGSDEASDGGPGGPET